jgi:hypothetical protein
MSEQLRAVFAQHIQGNAHRYFARCEEIGCDVRFVSEKRREASILYLYEASAAEHRYIVLVKMPLKRDVVEDGPGQMQAVQGDRPRLVPAAEASEKYLLEYRALSAIQDYFNRLGDKRFGTVQVLDFLPEWQALVMEYSPDISLRELLHRESRVRSLGAASVLDVPFRNAGAWLRAYHALPDADLGNPRYATRQEYIDTTVLMVDYLARKLGHTAFFNHLRRAVESKAHEVLPENPPLGLGHGDYAMRNILVGPTSRVTVLDTLARWRVPVYEDIGYFLAELKASKLQALTQGMAFSPSVLERYEREFLTGYYGQEPIPGAAIRLYELQAMLDRWGRAVEASTQQASTKDRLQLRLAGRYFRRLAERLL